MHWSPLATHWDLDPEITFLNHGSFGACPRVVLARQSELRTQLERDPVRFFERDFEPLLDTARVALAELVGCAAEDLAFVPNATTGVNTVLQSLTFDPGDELLVTDHEYNASRNALDHTIARTGARAVLAPLPFPLTDAETVLESILAHVTDRTRLLLIDHITSPTGLVLPIERIVAELADRGIDTLVDGAHGPGMVPLELERIGAAYYTGNCHKWLCTPKGSALLFVRRDRQDRLRPSAISHGANSPRTDRSRFRLEFDWTGTHDPTPFLCIPTALEFLRGLMPGGLPAVREHNRNLVLAGRDLLLERLGIANPAPATMIGSLASIPLPSDGEPIPTPATDALHDLLYDEFRIQVPVMRWPHPATRLLRISAQAYNTLPQYEALADALIALRDRG
ncbi:MAG: aminotransferase class V-fold PLP-dependent enzyme [bacterium]|nr:aminotransferase class V-fold PLP-dependent enzyme [bacterium]